MKDTDIAIQNASLRSNSAPKRTNFPKYDPYWWATFLVSNLILSMMALLFMGLEKEKPEISWPVVLTGTAFALLSVPITYGIGGHWRYASIGWKFWQPFLGGCPFVLIQSVAWIFFAISLLPLSLPLLYTMKSSFNCFDGIFDTVFNIFSENTFALPVGTLLSIGWCVFLSEILMISSLLLFSIESCENSSTQSPSSSHKSKTVNLEDCLSTMKTPLPLPPITPIPTTNTHTPLSHQSHSCLEHSSRSFRTLMGFNLTVATFSCLLAATCDTWARWNMTGVIDSFVHTDSSTYSFVFSKNYVLAIASIFCAISLSAVVLLTHGLGGILQCHHLRWSFWQPFTGGLEFVLIQAVAWSLFGFSLLSFSAVSFTAMHFLHRSFFLHGLLTSAGFTAFASEILLFSSLLIFKSHSSKSTLSSLKQSVMDSKLKSYFLPPLFPSEHPGSNNKGREKEEEEEEKEGKEEEKEKYAKILEYKNHLSSTVHQDNHSREFESQHMHDFRCSLVKPSQWTDRQTLLAVHGPLTMFDLTLTEFIWWIWIKSRCVFVMCFIYCGHYIFCCFILFPFLLLTFDQALTVSFSVLTVYFFTCLNDAHRNGRRASKRVQNILVPLLEESACIHFGEMKILCESSHSFSSPNKYIFCYHPHGLFPATMSWICLTKAWEDLFGRTKPVGLIASAVFRVPILRDLNLWAGMREVSKPVFESSLRERNAVMICPGGQSELSYHSNSTLKQIVLCGRKKGFIRMAMETEAYLVPMFAFGESILLDNFIHWPAAQRLTYKRLGFPIPFLPVGLCNFLPLPRQKKMALVVSQPIQFSHSNELSHNPNCDRNREHSIDAVHRLYYDRVQQLFELHKNEHGFGDWQLKIEFGDK